MAYRIFFSEGRNFRRKTRSNPLYDSGEYREIPEQTRTHAHSRAAYFKTAFFTKFLQLKRQTCIRAARNREEKMACAFVKRGTMARRPTTIFFLMSPAMDSRPNERRTATRSHDIFLIVSALMSVER